MKIHSNTLSADFIASLREAAINNKAAPAVIDQLDALQSCEDLEADLEKAGDELYEMEQARDDLREELRVLLESLPPPAEDDPGLKRVMQSALMALSRHGESESDVEALREDLEL